MTPAFPITPTISPKNGGEGVSALFATHAAVHVMTAAGELMTVSPSVAATRLVGQRVIVCHAPFTLQRFNKIDIQCLDILELFAFVYPGVFLVPSPVGVAQALSLSPPDGPEDYPYILQQAADQLLADLAALPEPERRDLHDLASLMHLGGKGWAWGDAVLAALNIKDPSDRPAKDVFTRVLSRLPEAVDIPARGEHAYIAVSSDDVRARLNMMLHQGSAREDRDDQKKYADVVASSFAPPTEEGQPTLAVIEAGTGIGKTLGYLAPASVWAEQNDASVWISTYTKNLQKQLDQELNRLPLEDSDRDRYAVTRKGRENYLCLLNYAEFAAGAALRPQIMPVVAAGLMTRWISVTRDGDFTGVDYPGWLAGLMGAANTIALADRRGECIHAGCEFYNRCFIERSIRKAREARIVLANHALVMIEAAREDADDRLPGHFIFDEGHHLIDAADNTFACELTLREGYDLRRWLLGTEGGRKSRLKGLQRRLEDLTGDEVGRAIIEKIAHAARVLPTEKGLEHLRDDQPVGSMEQVLVGVAAQVRARADGADGGYSLETPVQPMDAMLQENLAVFRTDLTRLQGPLRDLATYLQKKLEVEAADLNTDQRNRIQNAIMGIRRRSDQILAGWVGFVDDLVAGTKNPDFVDWLEITRTDGRVYDVGIMRHWRNPMKPFAQLMKTRMKGGVITSATLRDRADDAGWDYARAATGTRLLTSTAQEQAFPSPFDYAARTRVMVLTDVGKTSTAELAGACTTLMTAAGGGALALFTSIQRLRAVHARTVDQLEQAGLQLYAQHVDKMDNGTLVDLFRADRHACLMGTDAMRDGVDVPGDSLRLLIYDRVPWPQARLLHKARRDEFGGRQYDEQLARLRLKQAYGRLIRRADDRGIFVMLDSALPSRLHDAFPPGVVVERIGLSDAVAAITAFFAENPRQTPLQAA